MAERTALNTGGEKELRLKEFRHVALRLSLFVHSVLMYSRGLSCYIERISLSSVSVETA